MEADAQLVSLHLLAHVDPLEVRLDWYVVTGTAGVRLNDARDLGPLHTTLAAGLHRPDG